MSLRFITGAANSGKTGEVLDEALLAVARGESPVLVVPNHADAHRLESELADKSPMGVRVSALDQFVLDLWLLHGDGRRVVRSHERNSIIAHVLARGVEESLEYIAHTPGLRTLLARLAAQAGPEINALENCGGGVRSAVNRLLDAYSDALDQAGLVEGRRARKILADTEPTLPGPAGFLRFDTLERSDVDLLAGLAKHNAVSVALTWEPGFAPTRANDGIARAIDRLASERVQLSETKPTGEIAELARALFGGPAGLVARGHVVHGMALGMEAEIALVTRLVTQTIEKDTAPERVAVVFPDVAKRLTDLRRAFRAAEVPTEFQTTLRFSATPFGRAYLNVLVLALGAGGREEAMGFSASPFSGVDSPAAQDLDRTWRRRRVSQPRAIARSLKGLSPSASEAVDAALVATSKPLTQESLPAWQLVADTLLRAGAEGRRGGDRDGPLEDAAAYQAVSVALSEMARMPVALRPADAVQALRDVAVRVDSRETPGKVQVCDLGAVGARRFDVVIVGGLTDIEFSTTDRDSVEDEWGSALDSAERASAGDLARLRFYSLTARARDRLVLVRQEGDSDDREYRPSAVWDDVLEAYRSERDTAEDLRSALPAVRMSGSHIETFAPQQTRGRARARESATTLRFREADRSQIASAAGLSAIGAQRTYSATEVETYLQCPYRWFHERIVRPQDIDSEFDAREQGKRAHRLLAAFYEHLAAEGPRERVTPDWLEVALELFAEVARIESLRMPQPHALAERLAAARAYFWARSVIEADATFLPEHVPRYSEISFGEERPFRFAGVIFRGRIDRIDAGPRSVFVTDYKSAREVVGLSGFDGGGRVQPVIYAAAAEVLLGAPVAGSAYRSLRSGKVRGFWRRDLFEKVPQEMYLGDALDEQGFGDLIARTSERVIAATDAMKAGRIEPKPASRETCSHCGLSAVCGGSRR